MKKIFEAKDALIAPIVRRLPAWVTPNHISLTRLALTLPVVWCITKGAFIAAGIFFALGMVTDLFDGALARARKQKTKIGEALDPFIDKVFFGLPFILAGSLVVPRILYAGILIVELVTLLGALFGACFIWLSRRRYARIAAARKTGQIKMALYGAATLFLFASPLLPALYAVSLAAYALGLLVAIINSVQGTIYFAREL